MIRKIGEARKWFKQIEDHRLADEHELIKSLADGLDYDDGWWSQVGELATSWVTEVREVRKHSSGMDALLREYDLSSDEGIALMCMAEALLRIPDARTQDLLIADKLSQGEWDKHLGNDSAYVNASTWGLVLTGKLLDNKDSGRLKGVFKGITKKLGSPIIRKAVLQTMEALSSQFIMGQTIKKAAKRAGRAPYNKFQYSYDMLGEGARTAEDAERYFVDYLAAIEFLAKLGVDGNCQTNPGISVKLSALHPRYDWHNRRRTVAAITEKMVAICEVAARANIMVKIDAEESERLVLSLEIFENLINDKRISGYQGLGLAVQAYLKTASGVLDLIIEWARSRKIRVPVRLVKGAYWDTEIKVAQTNGLTSFPVFTRRAHTDLNYLVCAKRMLAAPEAVFGQFATHNAHTVATVTTLAKELGNEDYEFQCLHGMGHTLYGSIMGKYPGMRCRVYAPVGSNEELLPYLVRRMLENGANSSFVNKVINFNVDADSFVKSPVVVAREDDFSVHPDVRTAKNLFADREYALGLDWGSFPVILETARKLGDFDKEISAEPVASVTGVKSSSGKKLKNTDPSVITRELGEVTSLATSDLAAVMVKAEQGWARWRMVALGKRAQLIKNFGKLLVDNQFKLMAVLQREAGKTWDDSLGEVREAIDFCNYYAEIAATKLVPLELTGVTGEKNILTYHSRGVMVCISPWNFPLAIFIGQIVACLVTGNAVVAKCAEQTPLVAKLAIELLHAAGVDVDACQLVIGSGVELGQALVVAPETAGVLFTGSTATARKINRALAERSGPIIPLIAETGGQNTMVVDSSALPEQVVDAVIESAFLSAGQRCSATRILALQDEIADKVIVMLKGAMAELTIGDATQFTTDIGPIIDEKALANLVEHKKWLERKARWVYQAPVADELSGNFFGPLVAEIDAIGQLQREIFGPILHIVRYKSSERLELYREINYTGYGLTAGIQTRINQHISEFTATMAVGNIYVNRNTTGAVVGVQPFGGQGLSGTGPKAGGPNYLYRLCHERVVCDNLVAMGGNTELMNLPD